MILSCLLSITLWADPVLDKVRNHLSKKPGDYTWHRVSRVGDQTLELETYISSDGDLESASRILSDFKNYNRWLLKNINKRPNGGDYFIRVTDVRGAEPDKITIAFEVVFGQFHHRAERTFKVNARRERDRFVLESTAVGDATSVVSHGSGDLYVFPAPGEPGRVWVYIKGQTRLRSKLLYTLLPDAVLKGESGARVKRAIENYADWELTRNAPTASVNTPPAAPPR